MSLLNSMYLYDAFNLVIRSSLHLPELISSADVNEDINICIQNPTGLNSGRGFDTDFEYSISKESSRLSFSQVGHFYVKNGRKIEIDPNPGVEENLIRLPLLGATIAVLLYQRGNFVLHGSAVEINDQAVVILGNKGDGKSTLASMLCKLGHKLIVDDTVAIECVGKSAKVLPGFPQVKLYPDAVKATTDDDPDKLEEVASNQGKRTKRSQTYATEELPLGAIYVLKTGPKLKLTKLSPQDAVKNLIAHAYMARFTDDWIRNGIAIESLDQITLIAQAFPVFSLERPRDLARINDVAHAIEANTFEME